MYTKFVLFLIIFTSCTVTVPLESPNKKPVLCYKACEKLRYYDCNESYAAMCNDVEIAPNLCKDHIDPVCVIKSHSEKELKDCEGVKCKHD